MLLMLIKRKQLVRPAYDLPMTAAVIALSWQVHVFVPVSMMGFTVSCSLCFIALLVAFIFMWQTIPDQQ